MSQVQPGYGKRPSNAFRRTRLGPGLLAGLVGVVCAATIACGSDDDDEVARLGTGGDSGSGGSDAGTGGGKAGTGGGKAGTGGASGSGGTATGGAAGDGPGGTGGAAGAGAGGMAGTGGGAGTGGTPPTDGQSIFRHDTFGDEQLWTDTLQMHTVISTAVDPVTALSVGLKVDAAVLPAGILDMVDLNDPATTVALLGLDAVVGVKGTVQDGQLVSVGITCALCHSTVDDSVMPGIGNRIDGPANRDLNPGAILALSPFFDEPTKAVYNSWGPGRYDPRFNIDGINNPVLIPPIYGLQGVALETYSGDGPISYWNAYVGITQMGGVGEFSDPRIGVTRTLMPGQVDRVNPQLPALLEYQLSLAAPAPAPGSFNAEAATRGQALFAGAARCTTCHTGPGMSDAPTLHSTAQIGTDDTYILRTATKAFRTTPLRALAAHPPYFHDGSAATLADVVVFYNNNLALGLTADQQTDLVEYLKSL